jgi:hypothetical protein
MYKHFITIFICFCIFVSCKQKKTTETVESRESAVYTIDLDNIKTVDAIKMSSIFGRARAIILEETDYSLIGMINKLQVFDNYIFVIDNFIAKKMFVFNKKNGKYLRQIGSFGQGQGEYLEIRDFCLDTVNREVYIYDAGKRMLHKYNMDNGKFLKSINMRYAEKFFHFIMYQDDKIYANILDNDNLLAELDIETNNYKEFLNVDEYNCGWNESHVRAPNSFFISDLDSPKFVELLMSTVMSIDEAGLHPYITIKSKDLLQKSDILSDTKNDYLTLDTKGKVCTIQNYMESNDYIYFDYDRDLYVFFVVFNKKTGEAFQCNKVKLEPDLFTTRVGYPYSYLPFPFITTKNAYSLWHSVTTELTEDQIAVDLENREALIETLQNMKNDEFYVVLEYEFR